MPKVELAIGSVLVTIEHKQSDTRLKYRDLKVVQNCLQYLPSYYYPKIWDLSNRFQFVLYQNPRHLEENLRDRGVFIGPQQTFGNVQENRDFFWYGEIGTSRVPPRVLAIWAKTLQGQLVASKD